MTDESKIEPKIIKLSLHEDGAHAVMKPQGFLGGDLFRAYRTAIEGSMFDRATNSNVASMDKVSTILKSLREADFDVEVTEALAACLKKHTAQLWSDLRGSNERANAVDEELKKKGLYLFPFQRVGVKWLATQFGALLADEMGLGKLQAVSEPVLCPEGWRVMGDLRVGDEVIGSNGLPTKVLAVYPQGVKAQYRVTMTDGASTRAGAEHLWYVETPNTRFRKTPGRVMSTASLMSEGLKAPSGNTKWFIPMVKAVHFQRGKLPASRWPKSKPYTKGYSAELPVDSYLLGALLANGSFTNTVIHTGLEEQRSEMRKVLPAHVSMTHADRYSWRLVSDVSGHNPLTRAIAVLGLHGKIHFQKFVPFDYLLGSVEQRLALLQGLCDNDGCVSADGMVVEYNTVSSQLCQDVLELVRSLGGSAWVSTRTPVYEYKGEALEGQLDYRVRMALPEGFCPFRIPSKKDRYKPRTKYPPIHGIESIEECGEEESVCIRVDAADHLYVTRDYILTHNTIQALAALPASAAVLVVAPAVAKGVWRREIARWRPHLHISVISGRGNFRWPEPGEVVIINYDILPDMHKPDTKVGGKKRVGCSDKLCKGCGPGLEVIAALPKHVIAIVDEVHALKSSKAKRTLKWRALAEAIRSRAGRTWGLTATPLLNRPQELWAIYMALGIAQQAFGSWTQFLKLFNGMPAYWGGFEWGTPEAEVAERIRRVCLRRLRTDVLPELPVKTWQRLDVEVDEKTLRACDKVLKEYGGIKKILHLIENEGLKFETMSSIRHALAVAKIPSLLALIEQYEEQDEPVVVFSAHRAVVEELGKREGWAIILGGVKAEDRTRIEDDFQAGKLKGIAGTISAAGVGITLTRSHNAIFTDLEWTPALNAQAEDRICRIGQTRGCIITILQAEHELDERITELLMRKQKLITETVDEARDLTMVEDTRDKEIAEMMQAADEEVRRASAPRKEEGPAPTVIRKFRQPLTPQEDWAKQALLCLAELDPDRASEENSVGFNSTDGMMGHSLATQLRACSERCDKHEDCIEHPELGRACFLSNNPRAKDGLTNAQWAVAVKLCKKYHRQIGRCPGDENEDAA